MSREDLMQLRGNARPCTLPTFTVPPCLLSKAPASTGEASDRTRLCTSSFMGWEEPGGGAMLSATSPGFCSLRKLVMAANGS
jgi:hypothetical protein